jgi:hypothetical protein
MRTNFCSKSYSEALGVTGKVILNGLKEMEFVGGWVGFTCFIQGPVADCYNHGSKTSGSIKDAEFLDNLGVVLAFQERIRSMVLEESGVLTVRFSTC